MDASAYITKMFMNPRMFVVLREEIATYGLEALTYGSLTMKGLETVANTIERFMKPDHIQGFDLGCGDGELIWHLAKALPGSTWFGVEISESRVAAQTRDVCIWQGDMLAENFHVYNLLHADNLCLEDAVADRLEQKIVDEFTGLYISYREPVNMAFMRQAVLLDTIQTETTWSTCLLRYYWVH
jgi:hypothetical protein